MIDQSHRARDSVAKIVFAWFGSFSSLVSGAGFYLCFDGEGWWFDRLLMFATYLTWGMFASLAFSALETKDA